MVLGAGIVVWFAAAEQLSILSFVILKDYTASPSATPA